MEHVFWALILTVLAAPCVPGGEATTGLPRMTSELGCKALNRYKADCGPDSLSLIAPLALKYGTKPLQYPCHGNSCCVMESGRDCIFKDDTLLDDVMKQCSGRLACQVSPAHLRPSQCASPRLFSDRADYTYMEYRCVNAGHLRDVCDVGSVDSGETHHLVSNVNFVNSNKTQRSCSCLVSTKCGAQVVFKAVDIRLAEGENNACLETLDMADHFDPKVNKTMTCQDRQLYAWKEIFRSDSNRAMIALNIGQRHTGKLWVVAESSQPGGQVELSCGRAQGLEPEEELRCPTTTSGPSPTPSSRTTGPPASSTASPRSDGREGSKGSQTEPPPEGGTSSNAGIIAAAVIGAVLVVALLVVILVVALCILRKNKRSLTMSGDEQPNDLPRDPLYDNFPFMVNEFEEPIYHNNFAFQQHAQPPAVYANSGYSTAEKTPMPPTPPFQQSPPRLPLTPAPSYHLGEPYDSEEQAGEDGKTFRDADGEGFVPSMDNHVNELHESRTPCTTSDRQW